MRRHAIVMEVMACRLSDLVDPDSSHYKKLDEYAWCHIALEVAAGIQQLHHRRIVHRDIKADNVMIADDRVKLSDLGSGRLLDDHSSMKTYIGSPATMDPRALFGLPYTSSCDVYSYGMLLYHLVTEREPIVYDDQCVDDVDAVLRLISENRRPDLDVSLAPPFWRNLMHALLAIPAASEAHHRRDHPTAPGCALRCVPRRCDRVLTYSSRSGKRNWNLLLPMPTLLLPTRRPGNQTELQSSECRPSIPNSIGICGRTVAL